MTDDTESQTTSPTVKVTIEVSGHSDEVVRILDAVRAALAEEPAPQARVPVRGTEASWWTPDRAAAFVRRLKPPALHALRTIAESAPSVRVSVVQREMKRAGLSMTPGALSSIGFAVRALGSPVPFVRDNYARVYRMDLAVAQALMPAVQAEHDRRPALNRPQKKAASD
jgi:hypothetical protein